MGGEVAEAGTALKTAGKEAFHELMEIGQEWIAPLAGIGVGWLIGTKVGGQTAVAATLGPMVNPNNDPSMYPTEHIIGGALMFGIEGGIGFGLWSAAHSTKGNFGKAILKFFAGLLIGMGLQNLVAGFSNSGSLGSLDNLILAGYNKVNAIAGGS